MTPRVWNQRHAGVPEDAVSIMRPSEWGNSVHIRPGMTRSQVIAAHRSKVMADPVFVARVQRELRGKHLVCNCKPKPCHGDVLLEIANRDELI